MQSGNKAIEKGEVKKLFAELFPTFGMYALFCLSAFFMHSHFFSFFIIELLFYWTSCNTCVHVPLCSYCVV